MKTKINIYRVAGGGFMITSGETYVCKTPEELEKKVHELNPKLTDAKVNKIINDEMRVNVIVVNIKRDKAMIEKEVI